MISISIVKQIKKQNMKTLLITISTFAILFNGNLDSNENTIIESTPNQTEVMQNLDSPNLVSACYYEGELIPSVQLPTFNVIAKKETATRVSTIVYEGERIPMVQLPTLNVIANKEEDSSSVASL